MENKKISKNEKFQCLWRENSRCFQADQIAIFAKHFYEVNTKY